MKHPINTRALSEMSTKDKLRILFYGAQLAFLIWTAYRQRHTLSFQAEKKDKIIQILTAVLLLARQIPMKQLK